ncbi:DUF6339 family protein [Microbacterium sp. ACRRU]|uniref:DUF6339 family protein n=1 Tax=Microbacterium sp. ACRRU TaxID=2918204 RepID=UPI001EF47C8A|nr:DUF6339 family protein [Microbacterium sp. ACRRU]MCG7418211.1 DUF6339 family protein [Microbacterium sp. ACRRU]
MTILYPRLPRAEAQRLFASVAELSPSRTHHAQIFAPVGGRRATAEQVGQLSDRVRDLAGEFGFPKALASADRLPFDRRSATLLIDSMDISWSEAAAHDLWSFLALVVLPDVTRWRFGERNVERWIASDLTRHTWARVWWRGTVFASRPDLLDRLTESDLNQILERRVVGGDSRLVIGLAQAVLEFEASRPGHRRALIRDAAGRLRRRLAFIDARALGDLEVLELCRELVAEAGRYLPSEPEAEVSD